MAANMKWACVVLTLMALALPSQLIADEDKRTKAQSGDQDQGTIAVALYDGEGASSNLCKKLSKAIEKEPDIKLTRIGAADIRLEKLKPFDVVIFPGGYASKQGKAVGQKGRAAVNQYVKDGGGYLGICAGAYLATSQSPLSFELFDGRMVRAKRRSADNGDKPNKKQGLFTTQTIERTDNGKTVFPDLPDSFEIKCVAGPVFEVKADESSLPYYPLAVFRSQPDSGRGAVINHAAIVAAKCGSGRVIAISPHPEVSEGLESMVPNAIRWIAKRDPVE